MKLVYAIIGNEDDEEVICQLNGAGYKATKLSSTGGFLKKGNTTLMICTEDENVSDVSRLIEGVCGKRETVEINVPYMGCSGNTFCMPAYQTVKQKVEVGGAIIFAVDVCYYNKI